MDFGFLAAVLAVGLVAAVLVTANLWVSDWNLRIVLRPSRQLFRFVGIAWLTAVVLVAASPLGERLVVDPGLVVSCCAALMVLGHTTVMYRHRRTETIPRWPVRVLTSLVFLARHGIEPVVVAALLQPGRDMLTSALPFLAAVVIANAIGAFYYGLGSVAFQEVLRIVQRPIQVRDWMLGGWAYDRFLSRSASGNLLLADTLLNLAVHTGNDGYFAATDHALDLVEREVLPLFDDDHPLHATVAEVRDRYRAAIS